MLEHFWILILFPLAGAALNGLLGRGLSDRTIALIGCGASALSFATALLSLGPFLALAPQHRLLVRTLFTWIQSGDFEARVSFLLDPLSMLMILVVTGVGFLIHLYSVEYMRGESGYARYFAYLNLFIFMMSLLVLADNYLLMFVGWEGVGLCSYLLIGYSIERKSAGDAAKKAFVVNRVGDFGFLLGVFLIFRSFGTLDYLELFKEVAARYPEASAGLGLLGAISLLLFLGATGKSAQIPLYVWLPDAMEGPTPVSALIHAATMVTAGVYMIARSSALYSRAPEALFLVALVGTLTSLLAALIALAQRDIKKVLAYSTISQLGYMFLAVGVGAFGAGIFHLMTHAFFKALLFLGAGSVILALHHEQDLFRMGGLRRYLPLTSAAMWMATLAIAGVPLFSGFFSKDEILWEAYSSPHGSLLLWLIGVGVAALTSCYMFRLMLLAFHGPAPEAIRAHPPRELSLWIRLPLVVLAFLSLVGGVVGLPSYLGSNRLAHFLAPSFRLALAENSSLARGSFQELLTSAVAVGAALAGMGVAFLLYSRHRGAAERLSRRFNRTYQLLWRKFFVDELYYWMLVRPLKATSTLFLWKVVDEGLIDAMVNGTASTLQNWSHWARRFQSGYTRAYATWILGGALLIFAYFYYFRVA